MPVISPRRYSSTSTGSSSYLPPSVGGHTSSLLGKSVSSSSGYGSSYRSSSLSNTGSSSYSSSGYSGSSYLSSRTSSSPSSYRPSSLYGTTSLSGGTSSSYRLHSSYLTGGNNDTTSSRFGVSNNRYSRSSSETDSTSGLKRLTATTTGTTGKYTQNSNSSNSNIISSRTKTLQTKPPISGGTLLRSKKLDQVTSKSDHNHNLNDINLNSSSLSSSSSSSIYGISNNTDNNLKQNSNQSNFTGLGSSSISNNINNNKKREPSTGKDIKISSLSSLSSKSSSSLARQVATSGLDIYEKYSPANYIPKCELSRSRSLSEATTIKLNNDHTSNSSNLSNSSSNVHQLLLKKDNINKKYQLEENNNNNQNKDKDKDSKLDNKTATPATAIGSGSATTATTSASVFIPASASASISSSKDNKVNKLFGAACITPAFTALPPYTSYSSFKKAINQANSGCNNNNKNNSQTRNTIVINSNQSNQNNNKQNSININCNCNLKPLVNNNNKKADDIPADNNSTQLGTVSGEYSPSGGPAEGTVVTTVGKLSTLPRTKTVNNNSNNTSTTNICCNLSQPPPLPSSSPSSIGADLLNTPDKKGKVQVQALSIVDIVPTNNHSHKKNHCEHLYPNNSNLSNHKKQKDNSVELCNSDCRNSPTPLSPPPLPPKPQSTPLFLKKVKQVQEQQQSQEEISSSAAQLKSAITANYCGGDNLDRKPVTTAKIKINLNVGTSGGKHVTEVKKSLESGLLNKTKQTAVTFLQNFKSATSQTTFTKDQQTNNKLDEKIMSNNSYRLSSSSAGNLINNNNNNFNDCLDSGSLSPVNVIHRTPAITVTITTPITVTTDSGNSNNNNFNSKSIKILQKSNFADFRLDFYKNKRTATVNEDPSKIGTGTTVATSGNSGKTIIQTGVTKLNNQIGSGGSATIKGGNSTFYSTYRDQNFLKNECELVRSQLVSNKSNNETETAIEKFNNDAAVTIRTNTATTTIKTANQDNNNVIINNSNGNDSVSRINNVLSSNSSPSPSPTLNGGGCQEKLNNKSSLTSLSGRNLIKPLVHKTTNNKITAKLAKIITNNSMNCLQNSPELLDDIKFIDSDDSERQHNHQHQQTIKTGISGRTGESNQSSPRSSSPIVTVQNNFTGRSSKMTLNSSSVVGMGTATVSTLPLTSKQRDLINSDSSSSCSSSNNNSKKIEIPNKFNTLNDFKRTPSSISSRYSPASDKSSSVGDSPGVKNSSTARIVMSTITNIPKSSTTIIGNSHYSTNSSRDSTPSSSPQLNRRRPLSSVYASSFSPHHYQQQSQSQSQLQPQQQATNENSFSPSPSSSSSSPSSSTLNDKKPLSNKSCDIDESVRNSSIRSALSSSPTSSRYWDRDGRSSVLSSRKLSDTDDFTVTKTLLNNSSSDSSYEKSAKVEGLCGLRNIGNTCFMNSVIQCLSHTKELTKFLKTQATIRSTTKDQQILSEFAKLIREMWSPNVHSVTPLDLKSAFSSKHRMYSGYNQQDAQEFLRFFLDSLHCALNSGTKGELLKIDDSLSDNVKADITWEWYSKVENSVVKDLFVGQLKSTLKCTTCGNTSVTFDPFWDLSVSLPSSSRCKLDACLDLFIKEEILDGDEMPTCSKCKTRRKCTKSFTIQRFPKYLVIHLKRFSETRWSKLSNVVEFPIGERELNMAPYASNPSTNALYTLYAISNHMGSTAGGHYVALCKHPVTKKWHEFNDNVVSEDLSDSVLVSSSAYLLFYERA